MTAQDIEARITFWALQLSTSRDRKQRAEAWERLRIHHAMRSPETVRAMELARGLR